jgi:hypothetical protein
VAAKAARLSAGQQQQMPADRIGHPGLSAGQVQGQLGAVDGGDGDLGGGRREANRAVFQRVRYTTPSS